MSRAQRTIDHATIREWVEARGGTPAHVKRTGVDGDPGILRVDYPGYSGGESLEPLDWDAWFEAFEANELAFLFVDEDGSRFSKLVQRRAADEATAGEDAENERTADASGSSGDTAPARPRNARGGGARDSGGGARWRTKTSAVTINDASSEELDALYGIGPAMAARIVAHRRKRGPFRSPQDLQAIDGIDGATATMIAGQVSFR